MVTLMCVEIGVRVAFIGAVTKRGAGVLAHRSAPTIRADVDSSWSGPLMVARQWRDISTHSPQSRPSLARLAAHTPRNSDAS